VSDSRTNTPIEAPEPPFDAIDGSKVVSAPGDVPVRSRRPYSGPGDLLRAGMKVRLSPRGPICAVIRVNECAAYVRRPYIKTIKDKRIMVLSKPEAISPGAFVYPVEED
jgi:hypothetical protein